MKLYVVILIYLSIEQINGQHVSPCPGIFQYVYENGQWVGRMNIPATFDQNLVVNVHLSIGTQLPTNYYGHIELGASNDEIIRDITERRPIKYRVRFPLLNVIPQLTGIVVNNQRICSGPAPVSGGVTTNIKLEHTLRTPHGISLQSVNPSGGFIKPSVTFAEDLDDDPEITDIITHIQSGGQLPQNLPHPTPQHTPVTSAPVNIYPVPPVRQSGSDKNYLSQICGKTQSIINPLIVNGIATKRGDWPWLAAIYILKNGPKFICGGNLVTDKFVITAAHCAYKTEPSTLLTVLGKFNLNDESEESVQSQITSIEIHPDYRNFEMDTDGDIALLELTTRVTFTNVIRPICLWSGQTALNSINGKLGTVVGWGRDETGELVTNGPRLARAPVVMHSDCVWRDEGLRHLLTDRTFCAGFHNGTSPCNGDSGGGFLLPQNKRWVLRGLVSTSLRGIDGGCDPNKYAVYTDVSKYLDWIDQYIN